MHFISPNSPLGRWMSFLLDAVFICIAWAVCSLPIITIGASTAALNRVAHNWMKDRSDCSLGNFLKAFKENFRDATAIWLMLLPSLALILFNAYATWIAVVQTTVAAKWMIVITAFLWLAVAIYAFALQALFENTPVRTILNALRIALSHIGTTVILVALFGAAVFAALILPELSMVYTPFCVFLAARPIWNVLKKVIAMPEVMVSGENEDEDKGD